MFTFFFNDPATTEIYTLSLHDALPISRRTKDDDGPNRRCTIARASCLASGRACSASRRGSGRGRRELRRRTVGQDRKSTRLNSSHSQISYAVFCLKKKK